MLVDAMQVNPEGILIIVIRTLAIYFALLVGLRVAGKRELGQMTPFDLVVILIISNAVQNAMVGPDTSVVGGLTAAFTLLAVNSLIDRASLRWAWLGRRVIGSPTLLVNHGQFVPEHLRREGITTDEVMMALREHGVSDLNDVDMAVLETDGSISVVPRSSGSQRTRHRLRGRKPIV